MSLIGIDVGCSSVKTAAYGEEGNLLVVVSNPLTGLHPEPVLWEQDARRVTLHQERLAAYRSLVPDLISAVYESWR